jgi:hypothetical protein
LSATTLTTVPAAAARTSMPNPAQSAGRDPSPECFCPAASSGTKSYEYRMPLLANPSCAMNGSV